MKKLVLMDLDRTIIDEAYQIIDEDIFNVFKDAKNSMILGLNSDTPVLSLRQWGDYFGLNSSAPLVAERGAIIAVAKEKNFISKARFSTFRDNVAHCVRNIFPESKIIIGDATNIIRKKQYSFNNTQSQIIIINGYRECSFSCYFRVSNEFGELIMNEDWSNKMINLIENLPVPSNVAKPFYDTEYGIFIMNATDADKKLGSLTLLNKYYPDYKLFMIGDSISDYLGDTAFHCAVSNATDEFKERCSFVAKSKYTHGTIECINMIKAFK